MTEGLMHCPFCTPKEQAVWCGENDAGCGSSGCCVILCPGCGAEFHFSRNDIQQESDPEKTRKLVIELFNGRADDG